MAGCMKRISVFLASSTKIMVLLILFFWLPEILCDATSTKLQIINLQDGQDATKLGSNHFCYINSIVPGWRHIWTRIQVRVWSLKKLKVTVAEDEERLQELEHFSIWSLIQQFVHEQSNETMISISIFRKKTCFKVEPSDYETAYFVQPRRKFDIYLFIVFLAGGVLFILAESLSRSQLFYYSTGMSTGIIASLLILIFIIARLLPKKSPFYLLIVGGWSFSLYAIQLVFRNLQMILREHWHLALGYVAVVGFISFALCYRHGPLVDERSVNILSWTLQLFGLLLIYAGIQVQQVALAIILAAVLAKNLEYPVSLIYTAWRKIRPSLGWKPGPRQLLTEEEYHKQGEEETRRALEELRKHCASPEFSPWKVVSRLQSPKRFADFVEGSPHLTSNEVSVHAHEFDFGPSFLEDEFFGTDDEEEEDLKPYPIMDGVRFHTK